MLQEGCSPELWVRPRMANGVAVDLQRAEVEVAAARTVMQPVLEVLTSQGRHEEAHGFSSGSRLVEGTMVQEIVDIMNINVHIHHAGGPVEEFHAVGGSLG